MTECIVIPFMAEFEERMLAGKKTATTRTKKYGGVGDLFSAFNHTFQLIKVCKVYLQDVCSTSYQQEGFNNQSEFIECWKQLHPKKGYVPEQEVWYHEFKRVTYRRDK
jgi:hypothetical protein